MGLSRGDSRCCSKTRDSTGKPWHHCPSPVRSTTVNPRTSPWHLEFSHVSKLVASTSFYTARYCPKKRLMTISNQVPQYRSPSATAAPQIVIGPVSYRLH
jgi:hypothetical protein